jgi:hypothetical protein
MKRAWFPIAGLLIVLALLLVIRNRDDAKGRRDESSVSQVGATPNSATGREAARGARSDGVGSTGSHAQALESAHAELLENPSSARDVLAALRGSLFHGDQETSARAVSSFLLSRRDAPTGMGFAVGPDGVLAAAPSLRTALLNWHPTLDPLVSLEMAREILKTTDSADEYAVALRNLAWNDLDGDLKPELSAAFQNLLGRRDWREAPTAGYLESFDVAVALGDASTFQRLADFANPDAHDPSLVRAACMSLDRMILREPGHVTDAWNTDPQWLDQAPMQRASLLSRLDIRREKDRAVFLDYLSSDRMTAEEREYFEALYPNGNHLHGHRLVTTNEKSPTIDERVAMDREILREIDPLLEQAPAAAADSLRKIRERLSSIVNE